MPTVQHLRRASDCHSSRATSALTAHYESALELAADVIAQLLAANELQAIEVERLKREVTVLIVAWNRA